MSKKYKKFILVLLLIILVLVVSFFIYKKHFRQESIVEPIIEPKEILTVYVDGKKLDKEKDNFIYSSTLFPKFSIFIPENVEKESVNFQIDSSKNVLTDEFYGDTDWSEKGRRFIFRPSYMLVPQIHQVIVDYKDLDGNLASMNFDFILVFQESFDKPLEDSSVWIVPEDRSPEWFRVQDGKLLAQPATKDGHSSLAFLYPFPGDITVDFKLIPIGDNVSLVFYFLDSKDFVIGSNSNNKMILFRKGESSLAGKNFELASNRNYHIRITRKECVYQLAIRELVDEARVDSTAEFLSENIMIEYKDCSYYSDHIGFSLWQNSSGVFIDNVFITGFSTYKYEE